MDLARFSWHVLQMSQMWYEVRMKILRLALDVLLNRINEHTRDLAYAVDSDADWVLYIRGYIDPIATRNLIIEELYYAICCFLHLCKS
jgi:hypothetical protein